MAEPEEEKIDLIETLTALLVALVVVIGGLVAWRVSVAQDSAGDADYAGLQSVTNAEETRALNYVNAYEAFGSYATYWRYTRLSQLLSGELETADDDAALALEDQISLSNDLADANKFMFNTRFLNRDGTYAVQRQLGEMWADAAKQKDMEYESKFVEAEQFNSKANRLLIAFMILSIAPVFYALVESFEGRGRYVMLVLGSIFAVAGTVMALMAELVKG